MPVFFLLLQGLSLDREEEVQQEQAPQEEPGAENGGTASNSEEKAAPSGDKQDWRNFFAATDTVLKKTSDNLQHIKEASYFQKKEEKPAEPSAAAVPSAAAATAAPAGPPSATGKRWVDLESGGIDDETEVEGEEEAPKEEEPQDKKEPEAEPAPLQFIEDLPDVDVDDFAEVFDTTYVDNVESGEVKLHYIPDSPTTDYANEPDPFDTSVVDKVLHAEEPEPKKPQQTQKEPEKKKKKLVSLGCAVDVLTGKLQTPEKTPVNTTVDSKKRRVIPQEINLLADFTENGDAVAEEGETAEKEESEQKPEEKNLLDEILCVGDGEGQLPELGAVLGTTPRAVSPALPTEGEEGESDVKVNEGIEGENKEVDLSEFLESSGDDQDSKETKQENGKDLDLKDLVAEFDIIDKSEVTNETLIPTEPDPIEDEFDAEFAFLAAESVAKSKEKEFEELEDDPFDTSVAAQVLGPEGNADEKDPFDVSFVDGVVIEDTTQKVRPAKPPPPRPTLPKVQKEEPEEEVDPFDTSIAEKHLPVDHLASPDADASLPEALQPQAESDITKSASFDPFDTSIAESFGKTELKVLESELLSAGQPGTLSKSDSDFDFNPREEEEPKAAPCLLTSSEIEDTSAPVLAPSQDALADDFDPFDTSIAAKVEIQTLEAEFLTQPANNQEKSEEASATPKKKQPPPRPAPAPGHLLATTPTDNNPTLLPSSANEKSSADDNFDPFDTSIAESFGKTELKALENELLSSQNTAQEVKQVPGEKKPEDRALDLPIKPLRPPSPRCLLAATPLDENPTLQPVLQPSADAPPSVADDFDPFDTSIADQFGKTELKVLESELLVSGSSEKVAEDNSFDPRAVEAPAKPSRPSRPPSPARPQCLLTASPSPTGAPPSLELLAPTETKPNAPEADFDPFDTSIADKFGKTELKYFESELLDTAPASGPDPFDEFDPRAEETKSKVPQRPPKPTRPPVPPAPCLLATTPTDISAPLQPCIEPSQEPKEAATAEEEFDPFDTSIADKLGRTEIKFLEESLLSKEESQVEAKPQAFVPRVENTTTAALPEASEAPSVTADHFLSSSPTEDLRPTLQPTSSVTEESAKEFDPFDTSIADQFGKAELKTLESELLTDSGVKRNLSDDEFDPRQEEAKAPKRPPLPPQKPATPVNLLDSTDDHNLPDQPIQVLQAQSAKSPEIGDDFDPFDTSIAADIGPSKAELKYLETELLSATKDPFDTSEA
ncbi:Protein stoned-A [Penaeus vannamei]|uniref:Protein stoned-A n=1 Tax=Penaeus vannamei TaxID=6689 RepID=A0A3R7QFH8_PENVA|nr:Protein stoned-A [Penaeus vannamei]